jgi:hypothetical protein
MAARRPDPRYHNPSYKAGGGSGRRSSVPWETDFADIDRLAPPWSPRRLDPHGGHVLGGPDPQEVAGAVLCIVEPGAQALGWAHFPPYLKDDPM